MSGGSVNSPNIDNYYVGKGVVSIKLDGIDGDYVDCGNCPTFEFLPKVTKLDHFSSRVGTKKKDFSAVTEQTGTLTMVFEEYTGRNVGLSLMGFPHDSAGDISIDIFSETTIQAAVRFVGANDIGPEWTVIFPIVQITPSKALSLISDGFGQIELEGDVLANDSGSFGTATATLSESP